MQDTKKKKIIDGTVYIITSHFKEQGHTADDQIRRMIDRATKEQKVKKSL